MDKYSDADKESFIQNSSKYKEYLQNKNNLEKITNNSFDFFEDLPIEEQNSIKDQIKKNKVYHWIAK